MRSNGKKRVRRPIVMKWCGGNGGNTEEGLTPTVQGMFDNAKLCAFEELL